MAYFITHFWPGATEEQYREEIAAVHPQGGLPKGQIYHAAGNTDGGILIVAVWDSKESCDQFVADVLMPNVDKAGGLEGKPEERAAESFNIVTQ
jgi:hypothetical protein